MKILHILAATALAASTLGATAASARDHSVRHTVHHSNGDRGHHYGQYKRHHNNRHCTTQWRHHRRVTVCR